MIDCGGFICQSGECLPYSFYICDGTRDCDDGDDEGDCAEASSPGRYG